MKHIENGCHIDNGEPTNVCRSLSCAHVIIYLRAKLTFETDLKPHRACNSDHYSTLCLFCSFIPGLGDGNIRRRKSKRDVCDLQRTSLPLQVTVLVLGEQIRR